MSGKKAKSPAEKSPVKGTAASKAKAPKGGTIGSLKRMLGIGQQTAIIRKSAAAGAKQAKAEAKMAKTGPKLVGKLAAGKLTGGKPASKLKAKTDAKGQPTALSGAAAVKSAKSGKVAAGKKQEAKASLAKAPSSAAAAATAKGKSVELSDKAKGKGAHQNLKGSARGAGVKSAEISGPPVCREVACELMATTAGYCRMHYIKNWKKIKRKEMILKERKLNNYIEELVSKYPDKYIEAIRQDLASEKDFAKVIADLEIEEGLDDFESVDTETAEGIIDNLKRDFEDEGDVF